MYSGTTLTKYSGRIMGAHQKIDRAARKHLSWLVKYDKKFPPIKKILEFEGKNGPDGIKRKSPAQDEPWHYFNPFSEEDSELIDGIEDHYKKLVKELKAHNETKAAFEAAWLAHALVDGLTPAHHFPYEAKLAELRGGSIDERVTIKDKLVIPGDTPGQTIMNNWKMWGPKGLFTSHGLFELGIATVFAPLSFGEAMPTVKEAETIKEIGPIEWFQRTAKEIAVLGLYDKYQDKGWTPKLAWEVRHRLGPELVRCVTLFWYSAMVDANLIAKQDENNSRKS